MASQRRLDTGLRGAGVCQRGCGLPLPAEDALQAEHCCVEALRTVTDALEERSAAVEHGARMSRLRWNRKEQLLLAQVSRLQNQAQLAALQYQRRLHQYMVHTNSIAQQMAGHCKSDADPQSHRSEESTRAEPQEQVEEPEECGLRGADVGCSPGLCCSSALRLKRRKQTVTAAIHHLRHPGGERSTLFTPP
ncbi:unnamed protein product [Pleuronectes platessa]|uniref:Uncharacterized protein n=1 Tax=Pleuronectes platessa TaxID=8262 RepID=A0A9N7UHH5_PLEPL|nr:unnamed protein product [Pleuronectes platessa]